MLPAAMPGIPTIPQGKRSRALSDPEISLLLHWLDSGAVSRSIVDVVRLTMEFLTALNQEVEITNRPRATRSGTGQISVLSVAQIPGS